MKKITLDFWTFADLCEHLKLNPESELYVDVSFGDAEWTLVSAHAALEAIETALADELFNMGEMTEDESLEEAGDRVAMMIKDLGIRPDEDLVGLHG